MLKAITKFYYRNKINKDKLDVFSEAFKYYAGLYFILFLRKPLFEFIVFIVANIISYTNICVAYILTGLVAIPACIDFLKILSSKYMLRGLAYKIRTTQLKNYIISHFIMKKQFLSKQEWKLLKKNDPYTYNFIISDCAQGLCYEFALRLAKNIPDSSLMYISYSDCDLPINEDSGKGIFAHSIVRRENEIFDTNFQQSFNINDYFTLFDVKVYHEWNYEDFSQENFKENVSEDFKKWCRKNNVKGYENF